MVFMIEDMSPVAIFSQKATRLANKEKLVTDSDLEEVLEVFNSAYEDAGLDPKNVIRQVMGD